MILVNIFPESPVSPAIRAARRMAAKKTTQFKAWLNAAEREAIALYAKKHNIELSYKPAPWIFEAASGEKVAMPPGYFAIVKGVIEQITGK